MGGLRPPWEQGRGRGLNLAPAGTGHQTIGHKSWKPVQRASVLPSQSLHANLGIQPHFLNRGRPHPVVGIQGARTPWYPGSQQQGTELGLSVLSGTPHKDSQLCLPSQTYRAGLCLAPQTPMEGWCLFSQTPRHFSSHGELTATLTYLPQAAADRGPSLVPISCNFWVGRPHLASA